MAIALATRILGNPSFSHVLQNLSNGLSAGGARIGAMALLMPAKILASGPLSGTLTRNEVDTTAA